MISPIAGICILTVFASQCPLVNHIKSAAVSLNPGVWPSDHIISKGEKKKEVEFTYGFFSF